MTSEPDPVLVRAKKHFRANADYIAEHWRNQGRPMRFIWTLPFEPEPVTFRVPDDEVSLRQPDTVRYHIVPHENWRGDEWLEIGMSRLDGEPYFFETVLLRVGGKPG